MPIIFEREKINYLHKQDINVVNKNGGAIYTPKFYKGGGAIYKMGTKHRDGESIGSILSSAGNWLASNSSTIGSAASALGSVASTITGITKNAIEIDNMKKRNDAEIEMMKERNKAEIESIRNVNKLKKKEILTEIIDGEKLGEFISSRSGGKYDQTSLKQIHKLNMHYNEIW